MFYYADTSDSADRQRFKYDVTTALADTTSLTTYHLPQSSEEARSVQRGIRQTVAVYQRQPVRPHMDLPEVYLPLLPRLPDGNQWLEEKLELQRNSHKNILFTNKANPSIKSRLKECQSG